MFKYYNYHDLLSRNGVYNFVIGARGNGKTFGGKEKVIKDFIRRKDQFIYLRRYKSELADRRTWFSDIVEKFPDYEFRVNGHVAECRALDSAKDSWEAMGYFIALSTSQSKKSVPYPNVKTIIFDEFIIEKGALRYLTNEVAVFNDFYQTVDRWKDKTKVFFLANTISIMNPYFLEFDIRPNSDDEWIIKNNNFIVAHFPDSEEFKSEVYETRFGQFIKDSEYGAYSIDGTFADNTNAMISIKDSDYRYLISVETKFGMFSVWIDRPFQRVHITDKHPRTPEIWTLEPSLMSEGKTLVPYGSKLLASIRAIFSNGNATFSNPQARNMFIQIWRK